MSVASLLFDYQTLFAGFLAIVAAVIGAWAVLSASRAQIKRDALKARALEKRRLTVGCLILANELEILHRRGHQAEATIHVVITSRTDVTDTIRQGTRLQIPELISDWEFLSVLPPDLADALLALVRTIESHNFDMDRAGGSFGDDNFQQNVRDQVQAITKDAFSLRSRLLTEANTSSLT